MDPPGQIIISHLLTMVAHSGEAPDNIVTSVTCTG